MIETERLILRPFQEGDAADVFEYLERPAVNCFMDIALLTMEQTAKEVARRLSEHDSPSKGSVGGDIFRLSPRYAVTNSSQTQPQHGPGRAKKEGERDGKHKKAD